MDKEESENLPATRAQETDLRRLREARTVTLPNPYKSQQSFKGKHSEMYSTEMPVKNTVLGRSGGTHRPNVDVNNFWPNKPSTWVQQNQASAGDCSVPGHGRKEKRRGKQIPESASFEVKIDEFPELTGIFVDQEDRPQYQRGSWGLPTPTQVNRSALIDHKPHKMDVLSSSSESASAFEINSPSVSSSWANIASQPPKKPILTEIAKSAQTEVLTEEENNKGKKRRKKKNKKRTKGPGDEADTDSEKHKLNKEPPRFEDEEEFPGLAPSFAWTEKSTRGKSANLCKNENQPQSLQLQPKDQKKEKAQNVKPPFFEASKAPKVEKVSGKKSKVPVQLDIGNMLAVLEKKQSQKAKLDAKSLTLSVGGGLPVVPKQQPTQKKTWLQDKIAHNPLDSTSPLVKKGKQREVPKAKKPTALKKVILKEREERKQKRLLDERGQPAECDSTPTQEETSHAAESPFSPGEELGEPACVNDQSNEEKGQDEDTAEELTTSTSVTHVDPPKIHSRKFREYCTQMLSKDVDECVTTLLKELVRFQDRLYQKDPMKARMKRRIVMGLREVLKHLKLKKVKCVIISPNCERILSKGGLDEALHAVIDTCREQEVPFVFALSRKALGHCVNKAVPVSLVGIFNFDGAQDIYHKMIELSSEARKAYEVMLLSLEQTESEREEEQPFNDNQMDKVSDPTQSEEPEYIKLWKNLLEKDSNHSFLSLEEDLSSLCLNSDCTEHSDDGGTS